MAKKIKNQKLLPLRSFVSIRCKSLVLLENKEGMLYRLFNLCNQILISIYCPHSFFLLCLLNFSSAFPFFCLKFVFFFSSFLANNKIILSIFISIIFPLSFSLFYSCQETRSFCRGMRAGFNQFSTSIVLILFFRFFGDLRTR